MPMAVVYATVNGRLVQENRGGVVTRYVADTLGSVIQTRDSSGNQTSSTTYWPFGEVRTQTGTNPSPWGFCGVWGYYKDAASRFYVRLRTLRADLSRWMTVDPLWPRESAYSYVSSSPTCNIDPSGLKGCKIYICSVNSIKLKHQFICVEGPNGGCSMGMYPEGPGDTGYGNVCSQPGLTTCKLISSECGYASEVCACTRRYAKGSPGFSDYVKAGTCLGFTALMACCGCAGNQTCLEARGCVPRGSGGGTYDCLPTVGPNDQCPPGYRKRVGNGWVVE